MIGDPHAHPEYDNDRFEALGRFILDERPTKIICIGDMADMPSLSSYDKGKKTFEGRRYQDDVEATRDAQRKLFSAVDRYNSRRSKNKKKQYTPEWWMTIGNHEERILRVVNNNPEYEGVFSYHDLAYESFGWNCVSYNDHIILDGFAYSHHFATGVSGRPISGENIGKMLIQKNMMSSVQGHSHVFDHSVRTRIDGSRMHGLSIGCFAHPKYVEGWNKATHHMWWHGIVILDDVTNGDFKEMRTVDHDTLISNYL